MNMKLKYDARVADKVRQHQAFRQAAARAQNVVRRRR